MSCATSTEGFRWRKASTKQRKGSAKWRKGSAKQRKASAKWRKGLAKWRKGSAKQRNGLAKWRKGSAKQRKRSAKWRKGSAKWRKGLATNEYLKTMTHEKIDEANVLKKSCGKKSSCIGGEYYGVIYFLEI